MWGEKQLGKYKINARGNVVDMTRLSRKNLKDLEAYYAMKRKHARSKEMKSAYDECLDHIRRYTYEGEVADNADVFYLANFMDLTDIRGMVKRYVRPQSKSEAIVSTLAEILAKRTVPYRQPRLPSDDTIGLMFAAVMNEPPRMQRAADLFSRDFRIARVTIAFDPQMDQYMYIDYRGKIYVSLRRFRNRVHLFEALCEFLFNHLSDSKRWKFDADPELSFSKEKEERGRFGFAIMERCVGMGLVGRRSGP